MILRALVLWGSEAFGLLIGLGAGTSSLLWQRGMGLGICFRSCPPIQATPESPPLLRYNRYPSPSLWVRERRLLAFGFAGVKPSLNA